MKWSLNELRQAGSEPIMVNEELDLTLALKKRRPEIISASKVAVQGLFSVDKLGVLGYFKVQVELTLPSTRSLEPTVLPLSFEVTEHYVSYHEHDLSGFEDTDVVIVLDKDILDFDRVIEDNILLQIPMQVLTKAEQQAQSKQMPSGQDWRVVSESQLEQLRKDEKTLDPRLAKLADFFGENQED